MKYIKKFELFDFNQTYPVTSRNVLTNYYSCDDCDGLWKEFNTDSESCKYCKSSNIEELEEGEWYEIYKSRLNDDEVDDVENSQLNDQDLAVDLFSLQNNDRRDVN